ncbi:MAG TPA: RodZ domain-containing protein [Steroidobacteraceae bacterium]
MAVEAGGIGARLRAGREKLGLTVLQVAERIHTDPKIVEAIEAENFEVLGAPVYARGHIRHYADLVGESANELTQTYSNLNKVAQPDLTRIVKAPARPESNKLVAPALVVITVFAVAGGIWWISALSKKKPQMSETHVVTDEAPASPDTSAAADGTPAAADATGTPTVGGAPTPSDDRGPPAAMSMQPRPGSNGANSGAGAGSAQGRPSGGGPASAGPTSSGAAGQPRPGSNGAAGTNGGSASARGGAAGTVNSASAPGAAARSPSAMQPTRAPPPTPPAASAATPSTPTRTASATPARPLSSGAAVAPAPEPAAAPRAKAQSSVTLRYSADSWTEVYDASGARLFYDVGAANSVQTVVGTPPLRVVLGNASGVSVEYNGHSKPIAKLSRPDGSVQFSITRSGEVVRAKPVADGG